MTQTQTGGESPRLRVGDLVQVTSVIGFFRITELHETGEYAHVVLYGGRVQQSGGVVRCGTRCVSPERVEPITSKATVKRAVAAMRSIDEAMAQASRPHGRAPGKK